MLTPLKPFELSLPTDDADYYVDLKTGQRLTRVSTILSSKSDDKKIKLYHAIAVGTKEKPDYERADLMVKHAIHFGNLWHNSIHRCIDLGLPCEYVPQDAVELYSEMTVINRKMAYAGTIDLLYKNPQGLWVLRDFKSHSRIKSAVVEAEDISVWELNREVQDMKKTKWRAQLAAYVLALKDSYGIDVDAVEVLCFNVHTWTADIVLSHKVSSFKRSINNFKGLYSHYIESSF